MSARNHLPWYSKAFRVAGRPFFRLLFRVLSRVEIEGTKHIPKQGPYLVTPNHISIFEPPLVTAFWPCELEVAAAAEILDRPLQAEIMRLYGTVLVHRNLLDRTLIRTLINRLAKGLPVLIFPEGRRTRTPGLVAGNTGAAYIAARANVAVVPVGIEGTFQLWEKIKGHSRPRIHMRIGQPINFPAVDLRSHRRREILNNRTDKIMHAIAQLLPQDHKGAYA